MKLVEFCWQFSDGCFRLSRCNMTSSTGVRMFLCILGIGITLVAILSVLNKAHQKEAVWKQ